MSDSENPYLPLFFFAGCAVVIGVVYGFTYFCDMTPAPEPYTPKDVNLG